MDGAAVGSGGEEALARACSRVTTALRDSLGEGGCTALLARALRRTKAAHPSLGTLSPIEGDRIALDGVSASVEAYGSAAVAAALEALFAAVAEILIQLIGEEMAIRLIDPDARRQVGTPPQRTS
jgi:hypothetical protein